MKQQNPEETFEKKKNWTLTATKHYVFTKGNRSKRAPLRGDARRRDTEMAEEERKGSVLICSSCINTEGSKDASVRTERS